MFLERVLNVGTGLGCWSMQVSNVGAGLECTFEWVYLMLERVSNVLAGLGWNYNGIACECLGRSSDLKSI